MKKEDKKSALHIAKGTAMPPNVNQNFKLKKRKVKTAEEYVQGILSGNTVLLSQAITLVESTQPKHQVLAQAIVEQCLVHSGQSFRLGLTGTPGVGKSTFVESFGMLAIAEGKKVAVLAIDPTSQMTGGSILGDKTRMEQLSVHAQAFVRPSPAGDTLGGVAKATRESIVLCEAAGFDFIIVETVGVGQSETAVHSMVDFFLLLLLPNSGDELQGIKRGVMEMADLIAINKADGAALMAARLAKKQCKNGLHLFPPKASEWIATAELCSAVQGTGLDTIWQHLQTYQAHTQIKGYFQHHRQQQAKYWLEESIGQALKNRFYQHPAVEQQYERIEKEVLKGVLSPFKAAQQLLDLL